MDGLGAVVIAIFVGIIVAEYNAISQRKLNRRNLGIEAMYRLWNDGKFRDNVIKVMEIPREDIAKYATKTLSDTEKEKRMSIDKTINYYEVICAGVNTGVYDRSIIERLIKSQTIMVFARVWPFIQALRQQGPEYSKSGEEFQKLVESWGGGQKQEGG